MARRLERSGDLIFVYGGAETPAEPKREGRLKRRLQLFLALLVFVMGMFFFAPHALGWPAVAHALKSFLAAVR